MNRNKEKSCLVVCKFEKLTQFLIFQPCYYGIFKASMNAYLISFLLHIYRNGNILELVIASRNRVNKKI